MKEKDLIRLILSTARPLLDAAGYSDVPFVQNFQPTQQGRPQSRYLSMNIVVNQRYGSPAKYSQWDGTNYWRIVEQVIMTTVQINAVVNSTPEDVTSDTASDLLNRFALIMNDWPFQKALIAGGANILRITTVPNPKSDNDRSQWQAEPSFDVILTHTDTVRSAQRQLTAIDVQLKRV